MKQYTVLAVKSWDFTPKSALKASERSYAAPELLELLHQAGGSGGALKSEFADCYKQEAPPEQQLNADCRPLPAS